MASVSLILVVILLGLQPVFSSRTPQTRTRVPPDTLITLQRFQDIFGNGINYKVSLSSDGTLVFSRLNDFRTPDAKAPDSIQTKVAVQKVAQLLAEFERIKYFSLKYSYAIADDGCPAEITDQGGAITSLTLESKTKTIYHIYGCRLHPDSPFYPVPLSDLERKIDEITETKQWLK